MTKIALYSRPIENPDERAGTCNDVDYFAPRHIASAARVDNWSFDGGISRVLRQRGSAHSLCSFRSHPVPWRHQWQSDSDNDSDDDDDDDDDDEIRMLKSASIAAS